MDVPSLSSPSEESTQPLLDPNHRSLAVNDEQQSGESRSLECAAGCGCADDDDEDGRRGDRCCLGRPCSAVAARGARGGDVDADDDDDDDAASSSRHVGPAPRPRSIDEFYEEAYGSSAGSGLFDRGGYWLIFLAMGIANVGDAAQLGTIGYVLSDEGFRRDILHDDMATSGAVIASVSLAGMIVGGILTGSFEDSLGRKPTLLMGLLLNTMACLLGAMSPNLPVMASLYFCGGLGIGAILSSLVALSTETCPPSRRGFYVTFVASFWSVGALYVAAVGLLVLGRWRLGWRPFAALCSVPPAVGLVLVTLFVPESARFLALHGRHEEAARNANRVARGMGYHHIGAGGGANSGARELTVEEVLFHFRRGRGVGTVDATDDDGDGGGGSGGGTSCLARLRRSAAEARGNIAALYSPKLRRNTVTVQLFWIFLSLGSGLFNWVNTILESVHASVYVDSFLTSVASLLGQVAGAALVDSVGRKRLFAWCLLLSSASLASFAWITDVGGGGDGGGSASPSGGSGVSSVQLVISACLYYAITACAWSTISVLTGEAFPTRVRGGGNGLCAASGRVANICVQFVNGSLVGRPALLLSVTSTVMLLGSFVAMTIRMEDMSGKPLSDEVDGPDSDDEETKGPMDGGCVEEVLFIDCTLNS